MRRLFVLVGLSVVGVLASVTAAQAGNTTTTNTSTPFSGTDLVPCANGGAGEVVDFSGIVHGVVKTTINGNRVNVAMHGNYQGLGAVGETTGDTYVGNGAFNETFNMSLNNGSLENTFEEHVNLNGQGSAPNFKRKFIAHITVNANGDVTVFFTDVSVECG